MNKWNKLDPKIRRTSLDVSFWKKLLNFVRFTENKTFDIYNLLGIKLFNWLRVNFSHLKKCILRHIFANTLCIFIKFMISRNWKHHSFSFCYQNYSDKLHGWIEWDSITLKQPTELPWTILYSDCKFKDDIKTKDFWLQPFNSLKIVIDLTSHWYSLQKRPSVTISSNCQFFFKFSF